MANITINGVTIDPIAQAPALAGTSLMSVDSSQSDYILLQTHEPLTQDQKNELSGMGVKILEYVPQDAYIAHYPPSDLDRIRALPYVVWANVYMQGFKIEPALLSSPPASGVANLLSVQPPDPHVSREPKTVEVVLQNNVAPDSVRNQIAQIAGVGAETLEMGMHKVRLTTTADRLTALAQLDQVRHIEEFSGFQLFNNVASTIIRADIVHNTGHLEGNGEIVAVADTGLDAGSTTDVHPAFAGRVLRLVPLGRATASDPAGHGTHVCGSVLGDGSSAAIGPIRGTAPRAQLVMQSMLDAQGGLGGIPQDLHDLFIGPYEQDGARVHSNSWGDRKGDGSYSQTSREVDDFVWNHRDLVICFAAGNSGSDDSATGRISPGSVSAPGTAKNCITVGACESNRPELTLTYGTLSRKSFPVPPISSDLIGDNDAGMAAFSSRGPTRDHRIKPDVTAPGCPILSTRSRLAQPNPIWGVSLDPEYMFDAGTSMATPLVSGCAAVVRQFLRSTGIQPSAALVKAMLINGADAITGQYVPTETGNVPNGSVGFGRVNLAATVGPYGPRETVQFFDENTSLDTGQKETRTVTVPAGASTLKTTIVWTDPAGDALQNDLDLIVTSPTGEERHGNQPSGVTGFDRVNNVEQVEWTGVPVGDMEIKVLSFRITSSKQPYALVVRIA